MGVDVYGKAFDAEYEEDTALFDRIGVDAYLKLSPDERPWDQTRPGRYFQRAWWGWRALADFLCDNFHDITSACLHWQSNDGDGLNAFQSVRLADALDRMIETGRAARAVEARTAALRALPHEDCPLCGGTGVRTDGIADEVDAHQRQRQRDMTIPEDAVWETPDGQTLQHPRAGATGWCNGCDGRGVRRPNECRYDFTVEDLKEFAVFARHSGGFAIS